MRSERRLRARVHRSTCSSAQKYRELNAVCDSDGDQHRVHNTIEPALERAELGSKRELHHDQDDEGRCKQLAQHLLIRTGFSRVGNFGDRTFRGRCEQAGEARGQQRWIFDLTSFSDQRLVNQ